MSCIHQNAEVILEAFIARIRTAATFKEIKNVQIYQNTLNAQGDITKYRKVLEEIFKETYPALKNVEDIFIVEENTSSLALNISPEFNKVYEDIFINKLLKEKAEYDKKGYKNGNFTIFKNIDTVPFLLATDEFRALQGQSFRHSSGRVTKEFVRDYSNSSAALEKLRRKFGRSNVEYSKTFKDGMYVNKVQVYSPVLETYTSSNKQLSLFLSPEVDYSLKAVNILSSDKAKQIFTKGEKAKWDLNKILTELAIPKNQKQLLLDLGITDREQLALELASKYGYTVEINTAEEKLQNPSDIFNFNLNGDYYSMSYYQGVEDDYTTYFKNDNEISYEEYDKAQDEYLKIFQETVPTQHHSNLIVPGGTNYTENEISTPLITPSIKGHAQFSTDNGIGWFRSDDKAIIRKAETEEYGDLPDGDYFYYKKGDLINENKPTKTRRILEVQSDLFQKGRDKKDLVKRVTGQEETFESNDEFFVNGLNYYSDSLDGETITYFKGNDIKISYKEYNEAYQKSKQEIKGDVNQNQFLQLLNKNNNWVTFFVKSIIQDSAKKGYEKVLFPKGNTAAKIEGHQTLEDFKKQTEDRIKQISGKLIVKKNENDERGVWDIIDESNGLIVGNQFSEKAALDRIPELTKNREAEINQLKQELERIETEGFGALKPIYNFYENSVANILKKNGYNPVEITDEYGNQWIEIEIVAERDLANIHLSPEVKEGVSELFESNIQYQLPQDREIEEFVASEKTVRDLAARMSDRIGIPVRYISDRSQQFKGNLENGTAVINLAYATLDTPIHEILGHPIIRAIKKGNTQSFAEWVFNNNPEFSDKYPFIGAERIVNEKLSESEREKLLAQFKKETTGNRQLYQNLLKELEYGKGKEVFDRVKRDYQYKIIEEDDYSTGELTELSLLASEQGWNEEKYEREKKRAGLVKTTKIPYTLEEQQEEAIVELLGLMTAEKLDNVKDGKLISLLKRLLKEMKAFMKQLLGQKEVEIDKLPDNMTLGDIADLLAYSNSKLILPGYEVIYTTPDNQQFKTYAEASKHISELAKSVEDVDLDNVKLQDFKDDIKSLEEQYKPIKQRQIEIGKELIKYEQGFLRPVTQEDKKNFPLHDELLEVNQKERELSKKIQELKYKSIESFIEKNKEYEQSKEIIEEWKKVNDIQYNPEEVYSRGQEFVSVVGAYSNFDVNLMMQNLLQHLEDNQKAGGKFTISAFTKPIDRLIPHLEGGGGKIKFKIYPQSDDILWAANTDVFSGSVWDASEKVSKDKKSELLGVRYTKYPSLQNVNEVQPNLAAIIDDLAHHHNELGISLTGNNFRLEYDENIPYQTKKIVDSINSILDQKYGKLVKPEIKKQDNNKEYYQVIDETDGTVFKTFTDKIKAAEWLDAESEKQGYPIPAMIITKKDIGIQPTQTKENLKESIDNVQEKLNVIDYDINSIEYNIKDSINNNKTFSSWYSDIDNFILKEYQESKEYYQKLWDKISESKEYTSQAEINTKIAKLKEVAKKYPRSLIRSEVIPINSNSDLGFSGNEVPFQKIGKANIHLSPEVQDDFSSIWDNIDKEQEEDMIAMGIIKEPSKAGIEKEDNLKPYFETLLNTKLDLIRRIESKLDRLKTEKKRNKNNTEVLKSLNNEIEKYEEILEGSEITKGLKTQYQELKMTPALDKFLMYAEVELSRVDDLMKSERFEDTLEAKVILDFYSRINPEVEIENNTLFAKEDILDSAGNIDLTPETLNKLRDLSTQAIAKQAQIEKVQREKILERINELSKVTEVYQNPLNEQDIFSSDTGLKDITWFDMMMYDGQHNTFSQGDILRQTAQMLLEEEINKEGFWARDMDNRVKNIKDRLAKRLAKLGIKNSSIFMAKDSGFKTRRLISRETQKYFDKRNLAIYAKLRERNKEIALMEDFQRRQSGRINLAREILDWKRGNEIVLDINAIEEIQKLFPEFSDYFKDSQGIAEHLQELERNYGNTPQAKRELDKMIKEQINKIQEYKLAHDTFLEDLLKADNVTKIEDLSEGAEIEYINWVNFNSPFVYANDFQTFEVRYQQGNPENTIVPIVPQFKYNSFIPRKYEAEVDIIEKKIIEKTTETGYYDNDFSIIENDEVLLEFYDILRELVDYIYKNIPYEEQKNFNPFEIISVDKTLMETLNDPDVKGLAVVSKFYQWIMDWLKRNITEKPRSIVSNLAKNPITSEEEYTVNADFLKFASKAVQHKSTVEAVRLKQILGLGYNDNLSRVMSTNDITQSVLDYYSNLLGETITKQDIKNKFGSEYNPYKFLQKILLHNESQNYSSDLPKIVSYYSKIASIYAGRQRALPLLTSIKREYENIKTVRTNPQGIPLENAPSDINANLRTKANIQFSSWFNRAVLGEYNSKNEFGTVKKVRKLRFTSNEKENVKKIDKLLEDLAADRERLIKTPSKKSTQELMAITKIEENLLLAKQNMGSVITGASIMDGIFKFLRFKGLGWNLNGGITNFFEGQIANIIAASKNQTFSEDSFWRAIGVIRESNFKHLTAGKFSTKDSRKARIIMDNYDILQDMTNELQKSSNKSVYSGLNRFLPFELIRRIEYMNQTPVALAILMDTQIKNDKGETSSVWDALDEYGKLLPEFATETNKYNWEILSREETSKIEQNNPGIKRNQYNATKYTIIETLVNLHGDYNDLRGMMASEFISGKALLMFKRWWGMQVFSRFATEQMHLGLGREVKGRYRSLSAGQLANYGALIGGIFAGPIGAGVGAATLGTIGKFAGIERSTNAQVKSNLYLISEMFLVTKDMILKMIGIPVNAIAGKQLVKADSKWLESSGYSKIDIENIKGNIAEMSLLLGMTALMLIVKGLRGYGREDEDDEGLIKETTHNFLVNKIMQLADQTLSYNPYGIVEDLTSADAISSVRFMYDNALLVRDFANMLQGEGTILGGPNKGEERFLIQLRRTYLPSLAKDGFGFGASMERQFLPSPFDDISRSTEKITDREILKLRSKYQSRLESNLTDLGFTEEEVEKKVKQKMKKLHKKKKESKEAQLKRIKKVVDK